ncbi:MAG TPA: cytochrome b N-terminal domain-containing protein [Kofleriaceae bacterium]|nr:cytochrome b N-terminal domain-containing protein [Kofleriaceae bacterium]
MSRLGDWLDERVGHRALLRAALDEPVRGGARWSYVFGSALVFVLLVQLVTGVLLASVYSPSVTSAWASVAYLQDQVTLGWFIRGLHGTGASAMVILTGLHLLQVTIYGAYRRPREVNWWVGLLLMVCLFAFALTGYLLPWDQKGYWATQVATSLVGATPLVGPWLKRLVQGGPEYGNLTLTRFYALHTLVLPAATVVLVAIHVALFRKHGVTPGFADSDEALEQKTVPFWPAQAVRDLVAMTVVLALMVAVVARAHGVGLEAPADPASAYDARPEWYFVPLYQLLKYFPGRLEIVAALGAPLIAGGFLFFLPLVDRGPARNPGARKAFIGGVVLLLFGAATLGAISERADRSNPRYRAFRQGADQAAARALKLAQKGVPPAGGTAVYDNDPMQRARRLLDERCLGCHLYEGKGERKAPDLDGWSSRAWIRDFLLDPEGPRFYGATKIRGMKPVKQRGDELDALVEWVYSQGGGTVDADKAARGKQLFSDAGCDECHDATGTGGGNGVPDLGGRASLAWARAFLANPAEERFFGKKNQMPKFGERLAGADLDALAGWLVTLR